jgi:integrase/recombinase XerC
MWFEDLFNDFITHEKRFSGHTIIAYKNDISQFTTYLISEHQLPGITSVSHFHIRAWIVSMLQEGVSPRSVNRKLSCLKTYFRLLLKRELLMTNPMQKVIAPKAGKRLPQYVLEEKMGLLDILPFGSDFKGLRDRLIVEMLYQTGIRRGELLAIGLADIDHSSRQLRITGKGNKVRLVPFGKSLGEFLGDYLTVREEKFPRSSNKTLFLTEKGAPLYAKMVYNIVYKYLSLITTAEGRSPHTLRHSFATHLSDHGADLNAIKSLLGHSNLAATQIYTHNSVEKLKRVYDAAHPKAKQDEEH